jgi:hypothetical protein
MEWKLPNSTWLFASPLFAARTVSLPLDRIDSMKAIAASRRSCCPSKQSPDRTHAREGGLYTRGEWRR